MEGKKNKTKSKIQKLKNKIQKKNFELRKEIRKLVLNNYLLKSGWSAEHIDELHKSVKVNFWCGIGYSKAISRSLNLSEGQKAVIWSLIHRFSFC